VARSSKEIINWSDIGGEIYYNQVFHVARAR